MSVLRDLSEEEENIRVHWQNTLEFIEAKGDSAYIFDVRDTHLFFIKRAISVIEPIIKKLHKKQIISAEIYAKTIQDLEKLNSHLNKVDGAPVWLEQAKEKVNKVLADIQSTKSEIGKKATIVSKFRKGARMAAAIGALGAAALGASIPTTSKAYAQERPAIEMIQDSLMQKYQILLSRWIRNGTISDQHNYLRYLGNGEFITPRDVFEAYAGIVDERPVTAWSPPVGGYTSRNFLDQASKRNQFFERIRNLGYSDDDAQVFYIILTTRGNIVFSSIILSGNSFEQALPHERFHREMDRLSSRDLNVLYRAYQGLMNMRYSAYNPEEAKAHGIEQWEIDGKLRGLEELSGRYSIGTLRSEGIDLIPLVRGLRGGGGFRDMDVISNWNEFYPYLAGGELMPRVEGALRRHYSRAWEIFNRIREITRLH